MSFLSSFLTAGNSSCTRDGWSREPSSPTAPLYPESPSLFPVNSCDNHSTILSESHQMNNRQDSFPGATVMATTDILTSEQHESSGLCALSTGQQHPQASGCGEEVPDPMQHELIQA